MNEDDLRIRAGVRLPDDSLDQSPSVLKGEDFPPDFHIHLDSRSARFEPDGSTGCVAYLGAEAMQKVTEEYEGDNPDERLKLPETIIFQASDLHGRAGE